MARSAQAARNVATGLVNKILMLLLAFATRTLFIRLLGAEYVGVSSLYTNILSVLSLAELGIGNVLMFYLYSALAEHNEEKIAGLVQEFKKIYRIIILSILSVGIALVPFLKHIVKSELNQGELILYYLLYLINSASSYVAAYRTMVIAADQKSYISNIVSTVSTVLMYALQIIYLIFFRNFLGYLLINVLHTVGANIVLNGIALRKYPFLRKRYDSAPVRINKRELFKNIKATFLFKVSDTVLDQTDSIIISVMFGTVLVGYYSNYYMLIAYIVNIAAIIANGLVASFGNLNAEGDMNKSHTFFRTALLIFAIFGSFCTACFACVVQDFIPIWAGKQYVMDYQVVIAVLLVFYLRMVTNTLWMYRSAMGLFQEVQYVNIAAALLNIVLSIILGRRIGIAGVVAATAISRLATSFWYEAKVVYRRFGRPVREYFLQQGKDLLVAALITFVSYFFCSYVNGTGIYSIFLKIVICFVVSAIFDLLFYARTKEFQLLKSKVLLVLQKKNKS